MVQHGLGVAVFATEIASQVLLRDVDEQGAGEWPGGDDEDAQLRLQLLQKDLAEIFLGGFMHDCALWSAETAPGESHETAGARLLWNIPEIHQFLPSLTKILLFHSDVIRIAAKPALVQIVEHPDDPARTSFRAEFYRSAMTPVLRFASVATTCAPRSLARAACTRCCRWPSPSTASPKRRDSTRAPSPRSSAASPGTRRPVSTCATSWPCATPRSKSSPHAALT